MKKYEILNIELENVTDVIATSADVTTGEIPWQNTTSTPAQFFQLKSPSTEAYYLD